MEAGDLASGEVPNGWLATRAAASFVVEIAGMLP
jgi:hypothetical protein